MPTSIIPMGVTGAAAEVGGTTFRALNVGLRPAGFREGDTYSIGLSSGIMAAALGANTELVQWRWADAFRFCVIRKIRLSACVSTTFFAAGVPWQVDIVKCNTWTAAGTGGTRAPILGGYKKRVNMDASLMLAGDIGVSTTAGLTAGTKVLEGTPMQVIVAPCPTAGPDGTMVVADTILWQHEVGDGEHPLTLYQNEGFVIRNVAIQALGTWQFRVQIDWLETEGY
jgi:hypothetical protein